MKRALLFDLDDTPVVEEPAATASFAATAQAATTRYQVNAENLALTARERARELWYATPAHPYCLRAGISSWEGLWCRFEGEEPEAQWLPNGLPDTGRQRSRASLRTMARVHVHSGANGGPIRRTLRVPGRLAHGRHPLAAAKRLAGAGHRLPVLAILISVALALVPRPALADDPSTCVTDCWTGTVSVSVSAQAHLEASLPFPFPYSALQTINGNFSFSSSETDYRLPSLTGNLNLSEKREEYGCPYETTFSGTELSWYDYGSPQGPILVTYHYPQGSSTPDGYNVSLAYAIEVTGGGLEKEANGCGTKPYTGHRTGFVFLIANPGPPHPLTTPGHLVGTEVLVGAPGTAYTGTTTIEYDLHPFGAPPPAPQCASKGQLGTYPNCHPPQCGDPGLTPPTSPSVTYQTRAESRLSATLPATPGSAPIVIWNLIHQSFGTGSWHFRWHGDGSFTMIPPRTNPVTFQYSVTDSHGCTSPPGTVTLGSAKATFASVGSAAESIPVYLALGDSYSSGEGNPGFEPGTATDLYHPASKADTCHRSTKAYGPQEFHDNLLKKIPQLHFKLVACSGAVIDDLLNDGQMSGGLPMDQVPQISEVERYDDPNFAKYVRYISLTAGGNNAEFADILEKCIKLRAFAALCNEDAEHVDTAARFQTIRKALVSLYASLLSAAPEADIFVLDYPKLFSTSSVNAGCLIPGDSRQTLDNGVQKMDATIRTAVAEASTQAGGRLHLVELNGHGAEFDKHNLCGGVFEKAKWIHGLTDPLGPEHVYTAHPNGEGHNWMERQLDAVMKNYLP